MTGTAHRPSNRVTRTARGSAAVVGGALFLSACSVANSGNEDSGTDAEGGGSASSTVRIVLPQEPPTLEACDAPLTSTGVVVRSNITEPLLERNPTSGELEPLLATEWESTGENEWTFTLRDDVTFSDGTPFTAEAAAFSIERALTPELNCNVHGHMFSTSDLTTEVVDETTLKVTSAETDPILPLRLSFIEIVHPETSTTEKERQPIGTGPYSVAEWETGIRLALERNEDYWGEAPAYDAAEYVWRDEGTVRASMVTTGEADLATGLGPDDGAGEFAVTYPNNETVALRLDGNQAPLDDIRVREAINYAIDREGIIASLWDGEAEPAAQLIPDGIIGFVDELEPWPYDPEQARSLVEEAAADGAPVDTEITIIGRNAQFPNVAQTAEVIQSQLSEIGLNVGIQMVDTSEHLEYQVRPFPESGPSAFMLMHGNQAGDASATAVQYLRTDSQEAYFGDPQLDALIDEASAAEGEERQEAFEDVIEYERENVVQFVNIAHMTGIIARGADLEYEPNSATGDEMRLSEMRPAE